MPARIMRRIAAHLNGFHRLQGLQHGPTAVAGSAKTAIDTVAHPLDDLPAGLQERRLRHLGDPPHQVEGGVVPGTQ